SILWFLFFSSRRRHTRWPRDWSSDVCSSDLGIGAIWLFSLLLAGLWFCFGCTEDEKANSADPAGQTNSAPAALTPETLSGKSYKIGRASCRERVESSVVAGEFKKKSKRDRCG